jgi:hypothetical protein
MRKLFDKNNFFKNDVELGENYNALVNFEGFLLESLAKYAEEHRLHDAVSIAKRLELVNVLKNRIHNILFPNVSSGVGRYGKKA